MCDLGLPCGKLDCPCSGALKPLGEDVSALRRLEARRATVSDSVYSLDRMREATIKMRVRVGSLIILRAHDKTLSHSVRYVPARKLAFATSSRPSLSAWSCRNIAMRRESLQDGVRLALTNLVWQRRLAPLMSKCRGDKVVMPFSDFLRWSWFESCVGRD